MQNRPVFENPDNLCEVPPTGWFCTRENGHDGPCAAWPITEVLSMNEAILRGPEEGVAYVVVSGLSPEEKAHVRAVVDEVNKRLARERGEL